MNPVVILDPGHGMGNRKSGRFDPGAVAPDGTREADVALVWANEIRGILRARKVAVVRTRVDNNDPCSISERPAIARRYNGTIMLSVHCNAADGKANGTETFYRGPERKAEALALNSAVVAALGTKSRGAKTEKDSQHPTLAVMSFQPCFLIELGFIDHPGDRAKMLDPELRLKACEEIVNVIFSEQ